MPRPRTLALAAAGLIAAGTAVSPALAAPTSKKASAAERAAMAKAISTSPVAGINQLSQASYTVRYARVYSGSSYWGMASIVPRSDDVQGATVVLARPAGGSAWTVLDVGTSDVGCRVVPRGVAVAFKLGGANCGIRNGYTPAPQTLSNPTLTGYQLTMRFYKYLNPQNQAKLRRFLAGAFVIQRANNTVANRTQYLANHPTFTDGVIRVDTANYASGLLTVGGINWQTTVPNTYIPVLFTYAWVNGQWQMVSFAKFAASPTLPPPPTS